MSSSFPTDAAQGSGLEPTTDERGGAFQGTSIRGPRHVRKPSRESE
jgi:hypothetical protein